MEQGCNWGSIHGMVSLSLGFCPDRPKAKALQDPLTFGRCRENLESSRNSGESFPEFRKNAESFRDRSVVTLGNWMRVEHLTLSAFRVARAISKCSDWNHPCALSRRVWPSFGNFQQNGTVVPRTRLFEPIFHRKDYTTVYILRCSSNRNA